jgi:hypothetical protein
MKLANSNREIALKLMAGARPTDAALAVVWDLLQKAKSIKSWQAVDVIIPVMDEGGNCAARFAKSHMKMAAELYNLLFFDDTSLPKFFYPMIDRIFEQIKKLNHPILPTWTKFASLYNLPAIVSSAKTVVPKAIKEAGEKVVKPMCKL